MKTAQPKMKLAIPSCIEYVLKSVVVISHKLAQTMRKTNNSNTALRTLSKTALFAFSEVSFCLVKVL